MSLVAPTLQSFFTDRLAKQRRVSPRTIASYRDSLKLLVVFVHDRTGKTPCTLDWEDLHTEMICAFLDHLVAERHNNPRTRNLRLTAIRSLFAYAALRHPEHAELIQRVLAVPAKRFDKPIVSFLTAAEIDTLIDAPDRTRWEGRRDRALILLAVQTGLRVSELTGLDCGDISLGTGANVRCTGKGRKHRAVPLTSATAAVFGVWLAERGGRRDEPLFPTRTGRRLSSDAVERLVRKHAATAASQCPSIRADKLHPHVLRHSCAMSLLQAGVDTAVIALWLADAQRQAELDKATYHHAVRRLHFAGASLREIAEALDLSHQRVHQIIEATGGTGGWKSRKKAATNLTCTFCGLPKDECAKLIAGPGVFICGECVALVHRAAEESQPVQTPRTHLDLVPKASRLACSFCGKEARKVNTLVTGPGVRICKACLQLCDEILAATS